MIIGTLELELHISNKKKSSNTIETIKAQKEI